MRITLKYSVSFFLELATSDEKGVIMDIGYVRVSTYEQHMDRQLEGVRLDKVYKDAVSGKDTNRPELQKCLSSLQKGDILHVHSIDRLTRNLQDLLRVLEEMAERGVTVQFHKEKLIFNDDASPFQKLHLHIIGAVAEFERAFIRERQREGIAIAKTKGKYKGRKAALSDEQVREILGRVENKESVIHLAREFGVSRQTIYRSLRARHAEMWNGLISQTVSASQEGKFRSIAANRVDKPQEAGVKGKRH